MSGLILPDVVMHNLELERSLQRMELIRQRGHSLKALDEALRGIDPMLGLVRATENPENPALRGGFWHVRRCNAPFPDTYLVIEGDNGEFIEPHSGVLDQLRRRDLRRQGWFEDFRAERDREARERERQKARTAADRQEEIADRIKAYDNPGVSMGGKWTYRAAARKG